MVKMKMVTVRIINVDKDKITGQEIGGEEGDEKDESNIIDIPINKNIYLGMLAEMKKAGILVDNDLRYFNDRIFTIIEKEWKRALKELWIDGNPPKTFGVTLRKDLE